MTRFLRTLSAGLVALCLSAAFLAMPAHAVSIQDSFAPNIVPKCYANATSTTLATPTYSDITGLTCAFVPRHNDPTTAARPRADLIKVSYSIQGAKSTSNYEECAVYVNGATDATTARKIYYSTTGYTYEIGGTYIIPNTTVGSQTIKVMCGAPGTSSFTASAGHFYVEEIVRQ